MTDQRADPELLVALEAMMQLYDTPAHKVMACSDRYDRAITLGRAAMARRYAILEPMSQQLLAELLAALENTINMLDLDDMAHRAAEKQARAVIAKVRGVAQPSPSMLDAGEAVLAPGPWEGGIRCQAFLTWRAMEKARLTELEAAKT